MLNFDNFSFDYEPYPIGFTRPAFEAEFYGQLVGSFPPLELFKFMESKGEKYSLSQHNNGDQYRQFVKSSPPWRRLHAFIHSRDYITRTFDMLRAHNLDLDLPSPGFTTRMAQKFRAWKRGNPIPHFPRLKARFEFSAMPITGGSIVPHTDNIRKVVTMVVPILGEDEWNPNWGGGTSVVKPKDVKYLFHRINNYLGFDEVEEIKTFPFLPNQCLVFIKTDSS